MPRVPMLYERAQTSEPQATVFDHITSSRGEMITPFAAMLHRPELARAVADVGAVIRFDGVLSDHDRELVIVTTAAERDCGFEWESHLPLAARAGVGEATLGAIGSGDEVADPGDAALVEFVRTLCRDGDVDDDAFDAVHARLGTEATVELAAVVGYYTMLALFMKACDVC